MIEFTDSHAHIYAEEFKADRNEMLHHSFESGVTKIYMPNVDHASIDGMLALEEKYRGQCLAMMGLHPCYVQKGFQKELYLIEDWLQKRRFAAVGEIGIDLYWDKSNFEIQKEAFITQTELAAKHQHPIVIHSRNATRETLDILKELKVEKLRGVFHCFSGTTEEAKEIIELGFYLGIGGVVTFKNSGLDKVVQEIDLQHLILETDAPYLAPVPNRGKRNDPSMLTLIAAKVAEIKRLKVEEVANKTNSNCKQLFNEI